MTTDSTVTVTYVDSVPTDIEVTLLNDGVALESNETETLRLIPDDDPALKKEGVFLFSEIEINIIDSDGMCQ